MNPNMPNQFKRALASGKKQVGFWLNLESPQASEIAAGAGYDWLLLDMEHTSIDIGQIAAHYNAVQGGTAELIVRMPSNDRVLTKRLLDAGIRSLMIPFVQTRAEAEFALSSMLYPPRGARGLGGNSRSNNFTRIKEYLTTYDQDQCLIVQVESPEAIAAIPDMCTIDGLDGIFVGPNDLAANMGLLGAVRDVKVLTAIAAACAAIRKGGKAAGLLDFDPEQALLQFEAGFDFIAVGSDTSLLMRNTDALRAKFGRGQEA